MSSKMAYLAAADQTDDFDLAVRVIEAAYRVFGESLPVKEVGQ